MAFFSTFFGCYFHSSRVICEGNDECKLPESNKIGCPADAAKSKKNSNRSPIPVSYFPLGTARLSPL
uniref:Uncharacterized protein n=1 Tax=Nelumbo nucifera TaxID=4432 RepID=A0A822XN43_NELNU|nr:TPA_asm: hypothetical protein HUJ06_021932 [Nelumbo nucifera]